MQTIEGDNIPKDFKVALRSRYPSLRSLFFKNTDARLGVRAFRAKNPKTFSALYRGLEKLRDDRGVFVAAESDDYSACWIRDQLYATFAYYYLGEAKKFKQGIRVVFDILHKSKSKIEYTSCAAPAQSDEYIHAKYHPKTLDEITKDWGHHQVDAIGLFLYTVGFAERNNIKVVGSCEDKELLQLLVSYLISVRYWESPDNGIWEEWLDLHASSIGAAVKGLTSVKEMGLAVVPDELIRRGTHTLFSLLPNESPDRDADMAQLSLIWPYGLVPEGLDDTIVRGITEKLVQQNGLNRYLDDNYYRSDNGVSAEWTMGFFWLSIIASDKGRKEEATEWFLRGLAAITDDGELPELYQNGKPNKNTPLAWSHSLALIAGIKLHDK